MVDEVIAGSPHLVFLADVCLFPPGERPRIPIRRAPHSRGRTGTDFGTTTSFYVFDGGGSPGVV